MLYAYIAVGMGISAAIWYRILGFKDEVIPHWIDVTLFFAMIVYVILTLQWEVRL